MGSALKRAVEWWLHFDAISRNDSGWACNVILSSTFELPVSANFRMSISGGYQSFSSVLRRAFLFVTWVH